jgi:hypothetical protein
VPLARLKIVAELLRISLDTPLGDEYYSVALEERVIAGPL